MSLISVKDLQRISARQRLAYVDTWLRDFSNNAVQAGKIGLDYVVVKQPLMNRIEIFEKLRAEGYEWHLDDATTMTIRW